MGPTVGRMCAGRTLPRSEWRRSGAPDACQGPRAGNAGTSASDPGGFTVIKDPTRRFGEMSAVDDVASTFQRDEMFGLLGPDGGGTATLIRMLATVLRHDAGDPPP